MFHVFRMKFQPYHGLCKKQTNTGALRYCSNSVIPVLTMQTFSSHSVEKFIVIIESIESLKHQFLVQAIKIPNFISVSTVPVHDSI